MKIEKNYKRYG